MPASTPSRNEILQLRKEQISSTHDDFIDGLPKIELHVHIEGTITPELQWELAQRNRHQIKVERTGVVYHTLEELRNSYQGFLDHASFGTAEGRASFFDSYYGGFQVLFTEQDFYDLAMNYFQRAAKMNVRYCEPFFDPQGHTSRGVPIESVIKGLRRAQIDAEKKLKVSRENQALTRRNLN